MGRGLWLCHTMGARGSEEGRGRGSQLRKVDRGCAWSPAGNVLAKKVCREPLCLFFLLEHFWLCFCLSPRGIPMRKGWVGQGLGPQQQQQPQPPLTTGKQMQENCSGGPPVPMGMQQRPCRLASLACGSLAPARTTGSPSTGAASIRPLLPPFTRPPQAALTAAPTPRDFHSVTATLLLEGPSMLPPAPGPLQGCPVQPTAQEATQVGCHPGSVLSHTPLLLDGVPQPLGSVWPSVEECSKGAIVGSV